jgi:hypothetical protein
MTFTEARETLGSRDSKKIGNNTHLIKLQDAAGQFYIGLRLHNTVILEFHEDRTVVRTGGWRTATTKSRINDLPVGNICQAGGVWHWNDHEVSEFAEGDEIIKLAGDYRMAVRDCKGMLKGTFAK